MKVTIISKYNCLIDTLFLFTLGSKMAKSHGEDRHTDWFANNINEKKTKHQFFRIDK